MPREPHLPRIATAFAAALLTALSACSAPPEEPFEIGVLVPVTGSLAVWGINSERGVRLAAERINAAGGIDGREVRPLVEDSECRPERAEAILRGWIDRGGVPAVVGAICSSNVLALAPIAERGEVVILSTGASNPAISDAGHLVFRNWPSDRIQGELTADYAFEHGFRKVAVLFVDNAYGKGLEEVFRERFEERGGTLALSPSESYSEGDDARRSRPSSTASMGTAASPEPSTSTPAATRRRRSSSIRSPGAGRSL